MVDPWMKPAARAPLSGGMVRRAAEEAGSLAALEERLLKGEQALARASDLAWGGRMVILHDGRTGTFRDWLQRVVTEHGHSPMGRDVIARLARGAGSWIKQTRDKRRVG